MSLKPEKKAAEERNLKVSRYRAGKAPQWAEGVDEGPVAEIVSTASGIKIEQKYDPRLARLQHTHVNKEEALSRRRERRDEVVAEVVSVASPQNQEEEGRIQVNIKEEHIVGDILQDEDDDADVRRERARIAYLRKKEEEELAEAEKEAADDEEEEEEESEYETDSDYDEFSSRPTIQPVFVRKQDRETIEERDRRIAEEEEFEKARLEQLEERKKDSERLVKEELEREKEAMARAVEEGEEEKIDSDEESEDEAKEYELWKQREISRIKRDREERDSYEKEREDTAKRRLLSDMEIRQMDKDKFTKDKKKWRFMQKYYHKGAFFAEGDTEDIQKQMDFSLPTGEDLIDKSALPKVMQVKHFGRSGRTKYTHLADQDTTSWDAGWMNNDSLGQKFVQKLGGMHGGLENPALKKK